MSDTCKGDSDIVNEKWTSVLFTYRTNIHGQVEINFSMWSSSFDQKTNGEKTMDIAKGPLSVLKKCLKKSRLFYNIFPHGSTRSRSLIMQ